MTCKEQIVNEVLSAIHTIGALIYSIHNLHFAHVIWHLLVIGGTICMFLSIYFFI